jgi:hypothetical protein
MNLLLLFAFIGLAITNSVFAQSNITGSYNDEGIYRIENMSVRIVNEGNEPVYRFVGIVHNISNETIFMEGVTIQLFNSNNNLLDFTGVEQSDNLPPNEKILYKAFASTKDNPELDHYIVSVRGNESPSENLSTSQTGSNPEELYDECVRVAGKSFCDFLFKR